MNSRRITLDESCTMENARYRVGNGLAGSDGLIEVKADKGKQEQD